MRKIYIWKRGRMTADVGYIVTREAMICSAFRKLYTLLVESLRNGRVTTNPLSTLSQGNDNPESCPFQRSETGASH